MTLPMPFVKVDGNGLILAYLTAAAASADDLLAPDGDLPLGYAWRWMKRTKAWVLVPDLRGQRFASPDGLEAVTISTLVDVPPEGWTRLDARGEALFDGRRQARAAVEAERDRRVFAPFSFEGRVLDADPASQAAIAARRTDVEAAVQLDVSIPAELLMWRDHSNNVVRFDTAQAFAGWLARLSIALGNRRSAVYAWSWQQKERLKAATEPEEVYAVLRMEGGAPLA